MKKQPALTDATKGRIMDGFWQLFSHCEIEKITVNQLSAAANIHRSSFYRYFSDVYAVLELFEQQLLKTMREEIACVRNKMPSEDFQQYTDAVTSVFSRHADRLYRLFSGSCGNQFRRLFIENLRQEIVQMYGLPASMEDIDYYAALMASILITNLIFWYDNQAQYSFCEVNQKTQTIIGEGLRKIHLQMSRNTGAE